MNFDTTILSPLNNRLPSHFGELIVSLKSLDTLFSSLLKVSK